MTFNYEKPALRSADRRAGLRLLDRFSERQQRHGEYGGGQQVDRQTAPRLRDVAFADLAADGGKRRESEPEAETRACLLYTSPSPRD